MILGIDPSTYFEVLASGAKFSSGGLPVDPLKLLKKQGVSELRIRVWKNPYGPKGEPYLGGTCDYSNYRKLAQLGQSLGYQIVLDPHFSDFWCDPGKQTMPKGWEKLSENALLAKLKEYCETLFAESRADGIIPSYIQLGNEITNGLLWPYGKLGEGSPRKNYDKLATILKTIAAAAKLKLPESKLIIHLERSGDNVIYREFFDQMERLHVPFDVIGMSYYPYWHGTMEAFLHNLDDVKQRYKKPIMIMETGYGFTMEDYLCSPDGKSELVVNPEFVKGMPSPLPYPLSPAGQKAFLSGLLKTAEDHGVVGVFYWEPFWIPGPGVSWSSIEGLAYIGESGKPTRNEWANQCLFDYEGRALPALSVFRTPKGGK